MRLSSPQRTWYNKYHRGEPRRLESKQDMLQSERRWFWINRTNATVGMKLTLFKMTNATFRAAWTSFTTTKKLKLQEIQRQWMEDLVVYLRIVNPMLCAVKITNRISTQEKLSGADWADYNYCVSRYLCINWAIHYLTRALQKPSVFWHVYFMIVWLVYYGILELIKLYITASEQSTQCLVVCEHYNGSISRYTCGNVTIHWGRCVNLLIYPKAMDKIQKDKFLNFVHGRKKNTLSHWYEACRLLWI